MRPLVSPVDARPLLERLVSPLDARPLLVRPLPVRPFLRGPDHRRRRRSLRHLGPPAKMLWAHVVLLV